MSALKKNNKKKAPLTQEEATRRMKMYGTAALVMIIVIAIAVISKKPEGRKPVTDIAEVEARMDALLDSALTAYLGNGIEVVRRDAPQKTVIACSEKEQIEALRGIAAAMDDNLISELIRDETDSLALIVKTKPDIPGWVRKIGIMLPDSTKFLGYQVCDEFFAKSKLKYLSQERDTSRANEQLRVIQESLNKYEKF